MLGTEVSSLPSKKANRMYVCTDIRSYMASLHLQEISSITNVKNYLISILKG